MTWTAPVPVAPADEPLTGPERPIMAAFLAWQRYSLLNICAGLGAEELARRAVPPSTLSLLGLVRHLAKVERIWFRQLASAGEVRPLFTERDADFDGAAAAHAEDDWAVYERECRLADEAAAALALDDEFRRGDETYSVRLMYVHLCTEYARHNGHADMLRQAIDGVTGR